MYRIIGYGRGLHALLAGVPDRVTLLPHDLSRPMKALFLVSCGLAMVALTAWGGFLYGDSSAQRLSDQMASLVGERDAVKAQRDEALQKLEQLQQPPRDLAQINAKLSAVGTEYNRLWELAKAKHLDAARDIDSVQTGSIPKADTVKRAR